MDGVEHGHNELMFIMEENESLCDIKYRLLTRPFGKRKNFQGALLIISS